MRIARREFIKLAAAAVAAGRMAPAALAKLLEVLNSRSKPPVIWLQGAGCDGCAVSALNSIHYASIDNVLVNTLDVKFQSNLMAAAGDLAVSAVTAAGAEPGYILVIEGAIPVGAQGRYCQVWPNTTMEQAVLQFAPGAAFIIALGACASFGGVSSGAPNPTQASGVMGVIGPDARLINIPACPAHPDWFVGTVTYLLINGHVPPLDEHRRPLEYFANRIHDFCLNRRKYCGNPVFATQLGDDGCMEFLGCKGKHTYSDCPVRKWNASGPGEYGVNWCIGARSPCLGCVNPDFPDGMSPFYEYLPAPDKAAENGNASETRNPGRSRKRNLTKPTS